jgi:dTDP-4-amino-4,6-dideoxygalactose transaminase
MSADTLYQIPLFDLNYGREEEEAVVQTLRSRWISMGPKVAELETEFAATLQVPHALAVTNCTAALHLAMLVLNVGPGDEVIVPSLTFVATANAIRYVGATPVFADICGPADLNLDPTGLEALITSRTKAIMVMHYGGFPCAMEEIGAVARRHQLPIVEDACHGPLSEYHGRKLGTIGDIGCFSFFSNKNISTGEGGMFVTRHADYHRRGQLLRSHGMTTLSHQRSLGHATSYDVVELGYNYRLDDIRATLALVQLQKLRPDLERRAQVRERYLQCLASVDGMVVPFAGHHGFVSNYIFPVVLLEGGAGRREAIRQRLQKKGIQTSVHYPAVHRFSIHSRVPTTLPRTEHAADHVITLPMYAALALESVDFIAGQLQGALS